ncbi:peptidoglycan-binding domain-containing protein, partial [Streptomyces sp. NPDC004667]|uniref:peptidoglycan-binding domain-containing protein n=1 Tax=Streptomyces sp. NPDC004667 TaxID=3154285 RepID=UPI0033A4E489
REVLAEDGGGDGYPLPGDGDRHRPGHRGPRDGQGFTYVSQTGVYDEQTRRGVAQLQRDRDIKGDPRGIYGPATRAAFG